MKTKFAPLANFKGDQESLNLIYSLLTSLCVENNISCARLQTVKGKREQLLKIIWTMGYYGNYSNDGKYLELDAKSFLAQKIHGMYNTLLAYFNDLKNAGVHCEIVPLAEKGWLTPMGGLRKAGWLIRMSFDESLQGVKTLRLLKEYIVKLYNRFGSKAFGIFKKADLGILNNELN